MKGNLIISHEHARRMEECIAMLDLTLKEMKRLAKDWMPEALVRYGLDEALRDLCADTAAGGMRQVEYLSAGLEGHGMGQSAAFRIYQEVKELLEASMQQIAGQHITVRVNRNMDRVLVTVITDGLEKSAIIVIPA